MIVREVTNATATTIGDEVQVHPRGADHAAEAEVLAGVGAGVVAPGLGAGIEGGLLRGLLLHPRSSAVGLIHVRRRLAALGDPGHTLLPL